MQYKCLDTNILLLDAYNLINLGKDGSTIVIPATVLDEIDSKKSGTSEVAYQARQVGRLLSKAVSTSTRNDSYLGFVLELELDSVKLMIISPTRYPSFSEHDSSIVRDRQIIYTASLLARDNNVTFISNDVMCRIRAQAEGLAASDLKLVDNVDIEFTKTLSVNSELFSKLHNLSILEADPDYEIYNYNYIFVDAVTAQTKLGTVANGFITILGKETEKELRIQDLNPINAGQLFLSRAIQDQSIDIVVCNSSAGTGKTAIALSNAIKLVRDIKTPYESIHYIRASIDDVDKAEEIGFLSGNEEKLAVYLHPLEDTLDFIARNRLKDSKVKGEELELKVLETIEKLRKQCSINSMIGLGMRGRTFTNTVAIIDEAQNMSKSSLQKVLTRFGKGCKIIIIGSNNQIDNAYLNKYTNGLSTILDACTKTHDSVKLSAVYLPKVVRSSIAEFAENLFTERK
jgi:PhoH-like ATPase